jgi:DNA repair exonuclease SbcCD nuclease subunit
MRVLFLSDTHLGLDLPSRPRVARRRRGDDFFRNYHRVLDAVRAERIDVVVHGGDLLYRSRVPAWLVEAALAPLKRLADSGVPVLLVAGNHERGRVPHPLLALHDGLHIFDRPRTVAFEAAGLRVAFIGFPHTAGIRGRFSQMFAMAGCGDQAALRVLLIHQCVDGATCGPGNHVFRDEPDVIRAADIPCDVAVTLAGHIHRHQVLRPRGRSPVIYAGSIERTSFAEAAESKGYVVLELTRSGLGAFEFRDLPARPMVTRTVPAGATSVSQLLERVSAAIASTPLDAVVRLRIDGPSHPPLTAAMLRSLAGSRNVTLAAPSASPEPFRRARLLGVS